MLDSNVKQLLNEQVNKEFYSAYLYLDFSNFYKSKGLDGFANWYNVQAQEERDHALLFMQYLQNNNVRVTLDAIDKPNVPMDTLMDPLKAGRAKRWTSIIGLGAVRWRTTKSAAKIAPTTIAATDAQPTPSSAVFLMP